MIAGSLMNFQCLKMYTSANVTPWSCISIGPKPIAGVSINSPFSMARVAPWMVESGLPRKSEIVNPQRVAQREVADCRLAAGVDDGLDVNLADVGVDLEQLAVETCVNVDPIRAPRARCANR